MALISTRQRARGDIRTSSMAAGAERISLQSLPR